MKCQCCNSDMLNDAERCQWCGKSRRECARRYRREAKAAGKPASWKQAAQRIAKGIVGLAKVELGIDPAPADVVKARLAICEQCELSTPQGKPVEDRKCGELMKAGKHCGCWLSKKPRIAGEKCPAGKW